jgi:hypothetical protein
MLLNVNVRPETVPFVNVAGNEVEYVPFPFGVISIVVVHEA